MLQTRQRLKGRLEPPDDGALKEKLLASAIQAAKRVEV